VLYRVAEMMEGRAAQLVGELERLGGRDAHREVAIATDRWVWYAGWSDKIAPIAGTVNPVAGPYFDFTVPEPVGVVGVVAPDEPALLGFVSAVAPALCAGNAVVVLASERNPLVAITLAEILATSDLPPGVVNVLTGSKREVGPWLAGHGDVDTLDLTGAPDDLAAAMEQAAADDVKRVIRPLGRMPDYWLDDAESPYAVAATMELKTVWHPKGL
jgi:acyl-CoA reductase-like NAD-dependent aldehyde dehydrogenase